MMRRLALTTRASQLRALGDVSIFGACTRRDLRQIQAVCDELRAPAGRVLVQEGKVGREFFLLLDGTAVVRRNGRAVTTLGPGDYFGELSLLAREPRDAAVVAETDLRALVVSDRDFTSLVHTIPGFAAKVLATMATRLRGADLAASTASHRR
jgi:CRP/FNR family cyclic AMP-dependent transcriptional regulator